MLTCAVKLFEWSLRPERRYVNVVRLQKKHISGTLDQIDKKKKCKPNYKCEDTICGKALQQLPQMVHFKDTAQNVGDLHELQYHFVAFL